MTKIINVILGIGTAIIISLFFMLAMKMAFQTEYNECYKEIHQKERYQIEYNLTKEEQIKIDECNAKNDENREIEEKQVFITSIIIGAILVLLIIPLLFQQSLAAGVGASGIFLMIYGFARGWNTNGDLIKLVLLLITAILVVGITLFLNKNNFKKKSKTRKK